MEDWEDVQTVSVKRCIHDSSRYPVSYKLIMFTDASKGAYATYVYLQTSSENSVDVKLIFSKSRLASINGKLTISRTELMGFVSRRIKELRDYKFNINYVNAAESPADIALRGCTVNQIKESELW